MFLIAHRGAYGPENSLESIRSALYDGKYAGIEFDVRASKNGELYLLHDSALNRTTNMLGLIENKTSKQLNACMLSNGEKLPKLDDALAMIARHIRANKAYMIFLEPKIKGHEHTVYDLLKKHQLLEHVIIGHLRYSALKRWFGLVKRYGYWVYLKSDIKKAKDYGSWSVLMQVSLLRKSHVMEAKKYGLKIIPFTNASTNIHKAYKKCVRLDVDGLILEHVQ